MNMSKKTALLLTAGIFIFMAGTGCKEKAPPPAPTPVPTPTVIPHEKKIIYTFKGSLYRIEIDGNAREELFPDSNSKWFPAVSPDGWYVAYWVFSNGSYNLWLGDLRTNTSQQITFDSAGLEAGTHNFSVNNAPAWTPDSEHIIYARYGDIWKISRDGFNPEALTDTRNNISPAISMNYRLAYSKIEESAYNIYIRALYGKHDLKITSYNSRRAASASFSPDGKIILYNLIDNDTVNIHKYEIDSKKDTPLTGNGNSHSAVFSNDGEQIVFSNFMGNKYLPQIWIMDKDGGNRKKITNKGGVSPSWLYRELASPKPTSTPAPPVKTAPETTETEEDETIYTEPTIQPTPFTIPEISREDLAVKTIRQGDRLLFYPVIHFDLAAINIKSEFYPVLDDMVKIIEKYSSPIIIEGHTDNQPIHTERFPSNYELSVARAETVKTYLVNRHNISASRIQTVGMGEDKPIAPNNSPANMYKNRRAEIHLKMMDAKKEEQKTVIKEETDDISRDKTGSEPPVEETVSKEPDPAPTPVKAKKIKRGASW